VSQRSTWIAAFWISVVAQCLALYSPSTPAGPSGLPVDKVVHVLLFGVVAAIGMLAVIPRQWLLIGLLLQAVVSELVQGALLADRGADVWDFVADVVGIGAGLLVGGWGARRVSASRDASQ
jgi:hypothetical protein